MISAQSTELSSPTSVNVSVNAPTILSILDFYIRRPADQERVAGALLGRRGDNGQSIEITNCFPVPLSVTAGNINLDVDYYRQMMEMHLRVTRAERLVGWYITGSALDKPAALIHSFFARETGAGLDTVCMLVDASLEQDTVPLRAYVDRAVGLGDVYGTSFLPAFVQVSSLPEFESALNLAKKAPVPGLSVPIEDDLSLLEQSIDKLTTNLESVQTYVSDVIAGKRKADKKVGRYIMDTLSSLPRIESEQFQEHFTRSLQDILMVVYLSNVTRKQLQISEKIKLGQ